MLEWSKACKKSPHLVSTQPSRCDAWCDALCNASCHGRCDGKCCELTLRPDPAQQARASCRACRRRPLYALFSWRSALHRIPHASRVTPHASPPPPRSSLSRRPWRSGHKEKISAMDFFAYMDKDSSGSISKAEFSSALIK